MRRIISILFLLLATSLYSQKNLGLELFKVLKSDNFINQKVKFDSVFSKSFVDSLRNYLISSDTLLLPDLCNDEFYPKAIVELNDLMFCFSETKVNDGYLFVMRTVPNENSSQQDIIRFFSDELFFKINDDLSELYYINLNVYSESIEKVTTIYDPDDFSITEKIETVELYTIILLAYN